MAEGQVYVEVDASVVNGGIAPMAIVSGNPTPVVGQESFGVWLRWNYNTENGEGGFTGSGWYFNDPNNPINDTYESEYAFKQYLMNDRPPDLNSVLGSWGAERKAAFCEANQKLLAANNCFQFTGE